MTKTLVIKSIEIEDGLRCVDVFRRGDGSYGFEEYRRDPEDRRGWYATGGFFCVTFRDRHGCFEASKGEPALVAR